MSSYIYTFIRDDLSPEQKIVQIGHACYEAGKLLPRDQLSETPNLILLPAADEDELMDIADRLFCFGIDFHIFYEPDITSHTAICTRQITSDRERNFFREWDLYQHTY